MFKDLSDDCKYYLFITNGRLKLTNKQSQSFNLKK